MNLFFIQEVDGSGAATESMEQETSELETQTADEAQRGQQGESTSC